MLHAGADIHKRLSVVTVVDDEGKGLVKGARLPNDDLEILAFFKGLEKEEGECTPRFLVESSPSILNRDEPRQRNFRTIVSECNRRSHIIIY